MRRKFTCRCCSISRRSSQCGCGEQKAGARPLCRSAAPVAHDPLVWDPIAGVLGPVVVSDDLRAAVAPTVAHTRNHFAAEHPVTAGPEFLRSRCEIASETLLRPSGQTGAHS